MLDSARARELWTDKKKKERAKTTREKSGQQASLGRRADALIGTDEWGWYLRHMHEQMEIKQKELTEAQALLVNPASGLSDDEALAVRQKGLRLQTELGILEYLSELPAMLVKDGKKALKEFQIADSS